MKVQSYLFGIIVLLLSFGAIGGTSYLALNKQKTVVVTINSFEECRNAGQTLLETYPLQCKTSDGRTFVQTVNDIDSLPPPIENVSTDSLVDSVVTNSDIPSVTFPSENSKVKSPLVVTGEVVGNWYFEASFPVILKDAQGNILSQTSAKALGDWMTTSTVPFEAKLTWASSTATSGLLILKKDNPSGIPENDKEISIPIIF